MERTISSHFRPPFGSINSSRSYWLTRFLILRLLGIVYAVAFLVAINQILSLVGSDGLLPVEIYLDRVRSGYGSGLVGFLRLPSFFWLIHSDNRMAWISAIYSFNCRFCKCAYDGHSLVLLYVVRSYRPGMVWIWLGNTTFRNRISCDISLPSYRNEAFSKKGTSLYHYSLISLAYI